MTRPFTPSFVEQRTRKNVGRKAEAKAAKRLGARLTPGSGNMDGAKGDMVTPEWRIESKATEKLSISLKQEWLTKIAREARETNREPALMVYFVDGDGSPIYDGAWALIPERVWKEMQ